MRSLLVESHPHLSRIISYWTSVVHSLFCIEVFKQIAATPTMLTKDVISKHSSVIYTFQHN